MRTFIQTANIIRTISDYSFFTEGQISLIKDIQSTPIEKLMFMSYDAYASKYQISRQAVHEQMRRIVNKYSNAMSKTILIGARLKKARKNKQITIEELAQQMQITATRAYHLERQEESVTIEFIVKLAKALDVSIDYLLGLEEPKDVITEVIQQLDIITEALTNLKSLLIQEIPDEV